MAARVATVAALPADPEATVLNKVRATGMAAMAARNMSAESVAVAASVTDRKPGTESAVGQGILAAVEMEAPAALGNRAMSGAAQEAVAAAVTSAAAEAVAVVAAVALATDGRAVAEAGDPRTLSRARLGQRCGKAGRMRPATGS